MEKLKVYLSPFYTNPDGFIDEVSGLVFKNKDNGEIITYDVTKEAKLDGIRKAIRLNVLFLVEGSIPEQEVEQAPKPEVVEEVKEEVKVEVEPVEEIVEVKAEPVIEKPKRKTKA